MAAIYIGEITIARQKSANFLFFGTMRDFGMPDVILRVEKAIYLQYVGQTNDQSLHGLA